MTITEKFISPLAPAVETLSEEEAFAKGTAEKSKEFVKAGAEVYAKE